MINLYIVALLVVLVLGSNSIVLAQSTEKLHALSAPATHELPILQPLERGPLKMANGSYYLPATTETSLWGYLPNKDSKPVLTIPSGSIITFDTISCEGIMENQGRNPVKFFGQYGVLPSEVLLDKIAFAESPLKHDFDKDGPHVVMGPVAIEGAEPGDVLKIEIVSLVPRVPYGIVVTMHGHGVLPEFPESPPRQLGANQAHPELYNSVLTFVPLKKIRQKLYGIMLKRKGVMLKGEGREVRIPIEPFPGLIGVAANTAENLNSVPPSYFGGNMDLKDLTAGSTLYLPVHVPQAKFFTGDPQMAQGNGEVALTAIEGSLRETFKITLLKRGDPAIPSNDLMRPFAETSKHWIVIGFGPHLDDALKDATRAAVKFLVEKQDMDRTTAYAYLSAAGDFEITQAVDKTMGVHCRIRKSDFLTK